ncbi:snare associated Golgi protein-domain-containing protein [Umbelopsis sp. AD052]|nr:snare associated Golgi protein-domain-containing protein [Umbelopsis sp. AD052]
MTPSEGAIHLPNHSETNTPVSDNASSPVSESNENLPSTTDWQMVEDNVGLLEEGSTVAGERTTRERNRGWRGFLQEILSSFRATLTPYVTGERSVRDTLYRYRYFIGFLAISWITGIVLWHFKRQVFEGLENLSHAVEGMGAGGYVLIGSLIFLSAFPPMIGYGTYQTLSGFTFGFWRGFPLSYFGALAGSVTCFYLSRRWLKKRVTKMMSKYPRLEAVVHAVEKKGFKLFVLIRLAPYPFNIMNVMFSATNIPLTHYALGTAISLVKIAIHVYIGATLPSFAKHILGEDDDEPMDTATEVFRYTAMALGSILAFGVMIYVYFVAKRAVEEVIQEDSLETTGFLNPNPRPSSEDWMEWVDSDEDEADNVGHDPDNIRLTTASA